MDVSIVGGKIAAVAAKMIRAPTYGRVVDAEALYFGWLASSTSTLMCLYGPEKNSYLSAGDSAVPPRQSLVPERSDDAGGRRRRGLEDVPQFKEQKIV